MAESVVDITSYRWLVGTDKDLSVSNLFYLSIFEEGARTSDSNSHYFYLAEKDKDDSGISSTSPKTSTASSATTARTLTPTGPTSATPSPQEPTSSSSAEASGGLQTGGIIGVGVAVPVALILGAVAGWLFFGRRRRQNKAIEPAPMSQSDFHGTSYYSVPPSTAGYPAEANPDKTQHQTGQAAYRAPSENTHNTSGLYELS